MREQILYVIVWTVCVVLLLFTCYTVLTQERSIRTLKRQLEVANTKIRSMRIKVPNIEDIAVKPKMYYEEMNMRVTAYCPCEQCCGRYSDGITATGNDAYQKGVAVDPSVIPYGSAIDIPGYGAVEADDCGAAIKKNRLDVRFKTHQEALNWGVKYLTVRVYKKE